MKWKILSGCVGVILFITTACASAVFPDTFESTTPNGGSCTVASDIDPNFCTTFKSTVLQPFCTFPAIFKQMNALYHAMMVVYGSLQSACNETAGEKKYCPSGDTAKCIKACVGQWNCYWNGGVSQDMAGKCGGTGSACGHYSPPATTR